MAELVVLGLGNVLLGDDGLGVVALHRLAARHRPAAGCQLADGGTLGMGLLDLVCNTEVLVVLDAIRADAPPGTLVRVAGDDLAPAIASRLSPHQIGVGDVLAAARLLDRYPREVVLLGIVPASIDLEYALTPAVAASVPALVEAVRAELARLGHPLEVLDAPPVRSVVDVGRALGL